MGKKFNTAGPNKLHKHYCVDPFARIDWRQVSGLIDDEKYFVLHAPRQSGKTTLLRSIVERLNAEGKYEALYVNYEAAQPARNDLRFADDVIANRLVSRAAGDIPQSWLAREGYGLIANGTSGTLVSRLLTEWTVKADKPTVLMVDEIDSLVGDSLVHALRQLRDGYVDRPKMFPQSVILCGVRDVR
ncbi:MAG: ATP-binding protein, partial [Polyangiaceae bacterium]|nr:ATP-binding protein [Polyangiaceae bacterium]